ncbi:MAG TPA: GNAT family N-acetyltransferase [Anaerolineales bacterium]|nr:GNAT family N-acetyltransferase [Anaerolineales bacterium]
MNRDLEARRGSLLISTDPALLDIDTVCGFLARSYWASGRPRERIEASLRNSLVFGVYDGKRQVALARLVTDYVTFAWLCDVFVDEEYRGRGIGKWMMETIVTHPVLRGLKRIVLVTSDAEGLYSRYGFTPLVHPERWMERSPEALKDV